MLPSQPALKVSIHQNNDASNAEGFQRDAIKRLMQPSGIAGATLFHAHAGFGSHHQLHTEGAGPVAGEHLPMVISFIDEEDRVCAILPELLEMVTDGMVEAHPTQILKSARATPRVVS